jgi:hypothetical protein
MLARAPQSLSRFNRDFAGDSVESLRDGDTAHAGPPGLGAAPAREHRPRLPERSACDGARGGAEEAVSRPPLVALVVAGRGFERGWGPQEMANGGRPLAPVHRLGALLDLQVGHREAPVLP